MPEVISFQEAISASQKYAKRHLLLGNGFSIACVPGIFTYASLYSQADLSNMPEVQQVFEIMQTQDFELVVNALERSSLILPAYGQQPSGIPARMQQHAQRLKEVLIETLAKRHPERPTDINDAKYTACLRFLSNFLGTGCVYTLNYDLLLYWTLMRGLELKLIGQPLDGFGKDVDEDTFEVSEYVTWQGDSKAHAQNVHYLHGALHLYDRGADIEKFTWSNTGLRLIEQARSALAYNRFPLFVSEGASEKKMEKIAHNGYLYHSYKCFSAEMNTKGKTSPKCLFTYGVSFGANDAHILEKVSKGKVAHLFISMYGDPNSDANRHVIQQAEQLKRRRRASDLQVSYYDAASAQVWG